MTSCRSSPKLSFGSQTKLSKEPSWVVLVIQTSLQWWCYGYCNWETLELGAELVAGIVMALGIAASHGPGPALNWWPGGRCEPPWRLFLRVFLSNLSSFSFISGADGRGGKIEGEEWICSSPSKTEGCWQPGYL